MNGNDLSTYKDPNGKLLFVDFVDAVKKSGSGFVPYEWPKPGFDKPQPKLSYVVGFAPWNWLVGTGVYIDDLKAQTWASTQRSLIVAGVILLFMLAVSIFRGAQRHRSAATDDGRDERSRQRQPCRRGARRRTRRRGRRDGQGGRDLQEQCRRPPVAGDRATRGRDPRRREPQVGHEQDGRRFRGCGRPDRRDRVVGVRPTRGFGGHADRDRGARAGTHDHGRGGVRGSLHQRAVGGLRHRGDGLVRSTRSAARCRNRRGWPARPSIRRAVTNDRVSELSKAAARIGDVVELINTIAGQTNLLALNATIEAARAGEAGRGFAVVASEVKALAEQTAKATGEIGQQISGIQAATQESVNAIQEISGTIEKLSEISSTIAAAVEEQGAATQEISRNVQQAAHGHPAGLCQHHRRAARRQRDRIGVLAGACRRRNRCRATATASSSRSASSSTRCGRPDFVAECLVAEAGSAHTGFGSPMIRFGPRGYVFRLHDARETSLDRKIAIAACADQSL